MNGALAGSVQPVAPHNGLDTANETWLRQAEGVKQAPRAANGTCRRDERVLFAAISGRCRVVTASLLRRLRGDARVPT
jgi:hypothetical protein